LKGCRILVLLLLCAFSSSAQVRINCGGAAYTDSSGVGTLSIQKIFSLPMPQTMTTVIAQVTSP
jgi:hypothetical protein